MYSPENLVFLDETGFNSYKSRYCGYSAKNVKAYRQVPANRGTNFSCLSVISYERLVAYEKRRGAYNSEFFNEFLESHLAAYFRSNPEKILIMYNARFTMRE